ncbi:CAAX amino terminal protease self- immunity [Moraxella caprae]|uniref:CAAX amino terminal protease self- immunity n=1 Tax=Moraxella caprae TaxID=90240 RepID=A0A378R1P7_9GAMM|nr:CPBP family intramembrane glutamic endopeptidase [Moraxella caprae]STZ08709.1 CAAX amino terminal protease self- immunity [Moraxella caprae]
MNKSNKTTLTYTDFIILSVIFFGYFSYVAITGYLYATPEQTITATTFDDTANYLSIATELILLAIAGAYLAWRRFDFSLLAFSWDRYTLPLTLLLIIIGAMTTDAVLYGWHYLLTGYHPFADISTAHLSISGIFGQLTLSLVLFSLLNGFFEELLFMGLAFAVKPEHRTLAIATSLFVRFIFHVYQGIPSAIAITMTGLMFILVRRKVQNLVPFMLAHAVFDVFGAGILSFFLPSEV